MNKEDIKLILLRIIDNQLAEDLNITVFEIPDDKELFQYGIDSLNIMRVILEIEEEFDIVYDDDELNIENFITLKKICDNISEKIK